MTVRSFSISRKRVYMDQDLIRVLERIANAIEESNNTLSAIASHYDSVVPVMKRNADRLGENFEHRARSG